MIQKIINKCKFDKNDKTKNNDHVNLNDALDGMIILEVTPGGISACYDAELFRFCADDEELELMGWKNFKLSMIAKEIITEQDTVSHKSKVKNELDIIKADIKNDPEKLDMINAIRAAKGKGTYT